VYERYALALARGRYAADLPRAVADCRRELAALARRNRATDPKPTRALTAVQDHLVRRARSLGWSWRANIWQPGERRILDRYVRALVGLNALSLKQAARACWAELRELHRRSRKRGARSRYRPRTLTTIRTYLARWAGEAGRVAFMHWTVQEDAIFGNYARDLLAGQYENATVAAKPCRKSLADLQQRTRNDHSDQLHRSRPRSLVSVASRLAELAHRAELGWPCREWTAAENKICQGWVRWYGRYRRVRRFAPMSTAASGLQDDLAKLHHRRSLEACQLRIWNWWRREHGFQSMGAGGGRLRVSASRRARQDRQQENSEFRMVNMERQKWLTANGLRPRRTMSGE
jgi:hypothetical protein